MPARDIACVSRVVPTREHATNAAVVSFLLYRQGDTGNARMRHLADGRKVKRCCTAQRFPILSSYHRSLARATYDDICCSATTKQLGGIRDAEITHRYVYAGTNLHAAT